MEKLVENLFDLISNSNGYYMTDLNKIDTDSDMSMIWQENNSIRLMYDDEITTIRYNDIIGIAYDVIQTTIVAILKLVNRPALLIHIL